MDNSFIVMYVASVFLNPYLMYHIFKDNKGIGLLDIVSIVLFSIGGPVSTVPLFCILVGKFVVCRSVNEEK